MMHAGKFRLSMIGLGLLLVAGQPAQAFTLFPSAKDRAAGEMRRADRTLTRADAAFEGGNPDQARILYEQALTVYEGLQKTMPDLLDGLPIYRVNYCKGQLAGIERLLVNNTDANASEAAAKAMRATAAKPLPPAADNPRTSVPPRRDPTGTQAEAKADAKGYLQADALAAPTDPRTPAIAEQTVDEDEDTDEDAADTRTTAPVETAERPPIDLELQAADLRQARILIEDDQQADATRILVQVLREDPGNRQARLMIALARTRQGRYDEALVALEDLRGMNEDLPLLLALAGAYCGVGRHYDALLILDKAIQLAPENPHAYFNLAWLHLAMDAGVEGRRDAEAYYRQAVKLGARRDRALELKLGLE